MNKQSTSTYQRIVFKAYYKSLSLRFLNEYITCFDYTMFQNKQLKVKTLFSLN